MSLSVIVLDALTSRSAAALKRSCIGTSEVGVLGDRGLADQAGDEMGLRRDLQRVAQAGDLHRDQVLDHLAGALHRVLALHHDVEVEVVDQADQQVGELLVGAEHLAAGGPFRRRALRAA